MDTREKYNAILKAYVEKHGDEITPQMIALWDQWIEEALQITKNLKKIDSFYIKADVVDERWRLSEKYLHGRGIEIGGLYCPQRVAEGVQVQYVDRHPASELKWLYYEDSQYNCVEVNVIDDGEVLGTFDDGSLDFVIASHFLEHCQNPIGALEAHFRVLKPGGILYCVVPDPHSTYDATRERTPLEHVWRDYREGPDQSRQKHYQEWSTHVNKRTGFEFEAWWRLLDAGDYSIHFHVWESWGLFELFLSIREQLHLDFEIKEYAALPGESAFILRKG
jgi:predicted SAM-dependent methyltransferase